MEELREKLITLRITKIINVTHKIEMSPSDPRHISSTIAKVPPPATKDIPHASRFKS